jgi:hypothetical protein
VLHAVTVQTNLPGTTLLHEDDKRLCMPTCSGMLSGPQSYYRKTLGWDVMFGWPRLTYAEHRRRRDPSFANDATMRREALSS